MVCLRRPRNVSTSRTLPEEGAGRDYISLERLLPIPRLSRIPTSTQRVGCYGLPGDVCPSPEHCRAACPLTTRQRRSRVRFHADIDRTGSTGATRHVFYPAKSPDGWFADYRFMCWDLGKQPCSPVSMVNLRSYTSSAPECRNQVYWKRSKMEPGWRARPRIIWL